MAATGLDVFDKTLQTTHVWLNEIEREIGPDDQVAWHVLATVLRKLRDCLPDDLAAHLGAQLPLLVRGAYYDQFEPGHLPEECRSREAFVARIGEGLHDIRPVNPETATRAVLHLLERHVVPGQIAKVRAALPEPIRELWGTGSQGFLGAGAANEAPELIVPGRS